MASTATVPRAPGRLPLVGHTITLLRHRVEFLQQVRDVGDVVTIELGTRPAYVVNSPELIRQILVTSADKFSRGRLFVKLRSVVGDGLITSDGAHHRRQRRIIQPAFAHDRFAGYADIMRSQTEDMTADWHDGQHIQLDNALLDLGIAVVGKAIINAGIGEAAVTEVRRCLPPLLTTVLNRAMLPDGWEKLPTPGNRRFGRALARLVATIDEVIAAYRAQPDADHGDILSILTNARYADTDEPMPAEQIHDEALMLLLGGSETSAASMAWLFYELARHPQAEARLAAEIHDVLGDRPVTMADLPRLRYLDQVLNETVRRHSPIWLLMRTTTEDIRLGDVTIPASTDVILSMTALHRDPRVFDDPLAFDPDRWAHPDLAGVLSPKCAFIPFGAGPHKCIGDHFAWTEMAIAVATVMARWRLCLDPGTEVREVALTTLRPDHLPMIIQQRH